MDDTMSFPNSVDEFMEINKIVDTDEVYTNGMELVPIFRMKQWFEHESTEKMYGWVCPVCGSGLAPFTKICPCREKWEITC